MEKSSRMGQNKALLPIKGTTNIERIKNNLCEVFDDILLVANDEEVYQLLNVPITKDRIRDKGPLAGIQAGLLAAKHETTNIFVACDMPFISSSLAKAIVDQSERI
ncbi:nucleotidyltransferase family protein [Anaerobacillus sp. HL2]|nr:nucleotidyltransferase family protein [Anaerobacillus sp. HL2]